MSYWIEKIDKMIEEQRDQDSSITFDGIPSMSLAEFNKRNLALEIYSDILDCNIWLCSNDSMVKQIQSDNPGSVCYTAQELKKLIELNPRLDDIKNVNAAKQVFPKSSINNTCSKEDLLDRVLSEMDDELPGDLYSWVAENNKELSGQISALEERITELYKSGSASDFKKALNEYKHLHNNALESLKNKRSM